MDEAQKRSRCERGFQAERLPPLKEVLTATKHLAACIDGDGFDVRRIDVACNVIGVEERPLIDE